MSGYNKDLFTLRTKRFFHRLGLVTGLILIVSGLVMWGDLSKKITDEYGLIWEFDLGSVALVLGIVMTVYSFFAILNERKIDKVKMEIQKPKTREERRRSD